MKTRRILIDKIWDARKPSTVAKYCQSARKFFAFCSLNSVEVVLPMNSIFIADYLSNIVSVYGTIGAVDNAIAALKWLHTFIPGMGELNNPLNDTFISRIAEGQKRNLIKEKVRKKPLTIKLVKKIFEKFSAFKNPSLIQM